MLQKIKTHIRRWNIWRKRNLNGGFYKALVLLGLIYSPTFHYTFTPEETAQFEEDFWRAVGETVRGGESCSY